MFHRSSRDFDSPANVPRKSDQLMYQCPESGAHLEESDGRLVDSRNKHSYLIKNGVADFRRTETVSTTDAERLSVLNRVATETSYIEAITQQSGGDPAAAVYITDSTRHAYIDLLEISANDRVLEIGCSMGQCTADLANRCRELWAIDVVLGQAEFTLIRCSQEGHSNVHAASGGEDARLPYRDGVFDVVVLNLVLEWCGSRSSEHHQTIQRRMLSEISRVLRPGGRAWISTKNLYAMRLLTGGGDEHMLGIPFGSALPRWMGQLALAMKGSNRSQGRLYSHNALEKMIRSCGFDSTRAYWAVPDPRHPKVFMSADARSVREGRQGLTCPQGPGRWVSRAMSAVPAGLVKHVAAGNCFVATKSNR